MADTPSVPKGKECGADSVVSSGFSNWDKRVSGEKPTKEKGEKK